MGGQARFSEEANAKRHLSEAWGAAVHAVHNLRRRRCPSSADNHDHLYSILVWNHTHNRSPASAVCYNKCMNAPALQSLAYRRYDRPGLPLLTVLETREEYEALPSDVFI